MLLFDWNKEFFYFKREIVLGYVYVFLFFFMGGSVSVYYYV